MLRSRNVLISICLLTIGFATGQNRQTTVVLSLDGFRWDYAERTATPNLDLMATKGVVAEGLIPCFPSGTFANHYSMATGLHPDHHGIIMNSFYAPDLGKHYSIRLRHTVEDGAFYGGEPIWATAKRQGMVTATFFWVGSEAAIGGVQPDFWKRYDRTVPFEDRIDTVMHWLSLVDSERPDLVMFYFDEPDGIGHRYGPDHDTIARMVAHLDHLVGDVLAKMESLPHYEQINFIVLSDHGMSGLSDDRQIFIDQYLDTSWVLMTDGWNPVINLKIKDGYIDSVYLALQGMPNFQVWRRGEAPALLQYGSNPRTHDLTIVADPGWSIYWSWDAGKVKGMHGYDPFHSDMHGIFYAVGPAFKQGYIHPPFQNVHLYSLLARLLDIEPAPNDGDVSVVEEMLRKNQ
jgi:predicted AlkP superfamily pyrophosphatase or phosphodiesterase